MPRRALVTGGAGFIGSHLARRLLADGWDVTIIDNLSSGQARNIPRQARFTWGDLTHDETVGALAAEAVDVVFHLASHVGQEASFERPVYDLEANALATLRLLQWSRQRGVSQFVFASSMNVYGNPAELPVSERSPVEPSSFYAVGKMTSEYYCRIFQRLGLNTTTLRLFNVYGPLQDMANLKQGMVSIYMAYVAKGEPILVRGATSRFRDFVHVDDVVDAFCAVVDPRAYGRTYNVATGRKTHVAELLDLIVRAFGHAPRRYPVTSGPPTPEDQFGIWGDASAMASELGWKAKVRLEDGIERMAAWVKGDQADS
jgi:UDP-glucose 4-epimerase